MRTDEITCELVAEGDLDTRYLAGRLNQQEAEAFEAHFFGCEPCWGLVQQGLAVRSALGAEAVVPQLPPAESVSSRARSSLWGLAAAAAVAVVVLGTWWTGQRSDPAGEDVFRGGETPFAVIASGTNGTLQAAWSRVPNADLYRVRLYASDGGLVGEREVADTAIALARDSLSLPPDGAAFWQVQALDRLRNPIAGSELTKAVLPSSAP